MARVLQQGCVPLVADPQNPDPVVCFAFHPDSLHHMTWIVDEVPADWELPVTFAYSDGIVEVSADGTDAHEFDLEGSYTIKGTDASGTRSCTVNVEVPTP